MKILIATEEYDYISNGLWNATKNLSVALNDHGMNTFIFTNKQHWINRKSQFESNIGCRINGYGPYQIIIKRNNEPIISRFITFQYYLNIILNLMLILCHAPFDLLKIFRIRPDVIIVQSGGLPNGLLSRYILIIAYIVRIPRRIYVINSYPQTISRISKLYFPVLLQGLNFFSNNIVTVSNDVKKHILMHNNKIQLNVIYNGVVYNKPEKYKNKQINLSFKNLHLGFLGAFIPEKGLNLLLEALILLDENFEVTVAGNTMIGTSYSDLIFKKISTLNKRKKVHIQVLNTLNDTEAFFDAIDVLVVPSPREAFGIVAIEAFQHGVPVVCGKIGGLREVVIENFSGLLFENNNFYDLAKILGQINRDKELINVLSRNARTASELWTISKTKDEYLKIINQVL